ncbi:hypothetical protein RJT34_21591 [Clitoria ternatea]|uniref:Uncharacterized protein n=1 Tax=Clitoria ternatea TaxID=43366 RepID=A0AAN9P5T5_CLITE
MELGLGFGNTTLSATGYCLSLVASVALPVATVLPTTLPPTKVKRIFVALDNICGKGFFRGTNAFLSIFRFFLAKISVSVFQASAPPVMGCCC